MSTNIVTAGVRIQNRSKHLADKRLEYEALNSDC